MSSRPLNVLLFLGSARNAAPHWAQYKPFPARTGDRVLKFLMKRVDALNASEGASLDITVYDPLSSPKLLDMTLNNGNPTYYHSANSSDWGPELEDLVQKVDAADAFIIVCPEYNHTIPPALTCIMNHVGCSKYANKVSGTVTYSGFSSAAGGARCAVALRPFLSELGCLPVSKQVVIPDANGQLDEEGTPQGAHTSGLEKTSDAMLEQLRWWATAARAMRSKAE